MKSEQEIRKVRDAMWRSIKKSENPLHMLAMGCAMDILTWTLNEPSGFDAQMEEALMAGKQISIGGDFWKSV